MTLGAEPGLDIEYTACNCVSDGGPGTGAKYGGTIRHVEAARS